LNSTFKLFLQVDVSEHLWSRTAGLCGTLDGVSNNDMVCRDGKSVDSLPVFFSSWEAEFLGSKKIFLSERK
jgi:hypothetical protein